MESLPQPRSRARFWLAVGVFWLVWGCLNTARLRTLKPSEITLSQVAHYAFSDALIWALFTPGILWLGSRLPIQSPRVLSRLSIHVLLGVGVGVLETFVDAFQHELVQFGISGAMDVGEFMSFALPQRLYLNLMIYGAIVAIGHVFERQRRVNALRADLAEARLSALRLQLQPHFLFNCLNAISGLVKSRPDEARQMIGQLSSLLRLSLTTHYEDEIPLRDELRFVRVYLELERARFGDRLVVREDVADDCLDVFVPAFLLQPLVENAVRHGLLPRPEGGCVEIRAQRRGRRLELAVTDDGVGLVNGTSSSGVGLTTTRARLQERYGADSGWTVGESPGGGTAVAISLPIRELAVTA